MTTTDTPTLPAKKDAYSFDETTREYLGRVEVFLSPLEGTYYLPHNVVAIAPPSLGVNTCARLNADGTAWEVVPDFRRGMLWDTATGLVVPNTLALGDVPPTTITAEAPPVLRSDAPVMNVWDADARAWHQLPDYSRTPLWSKDTGQHAPALTPREPLPDTLTAIAPPHVGEHQAPRWNAQHAGWDVVADYRGVAYWTADGTHHVITALGEEPPADVLSTPPTPTEA